MEKDIKKIREAVLTNRTGLKNARDEQIMIIWRTLDEQTRKKYLESINERKKKDAVSDKSKRDI